MTQMRLFAISDLHLSFARPKPMELFGDHWKDHPEKIQKSWSELVTKDDLVLVAGDISWAMKVHDAKLDIDWLRELPGRKVIIKGNHDYWFPGTRRKRQELCGEEIFPLYRNSVVINDIGFIGAKGVSFDPFEINDEEKWEKDKEKQKNHLLAAIADLNEHNPRVRTKVALLHYPPAPPGETKSEFTELLAKADVQLCVFGHLHNASDFEQAINGLYDGVQYRLTSADYLAFRPLELTNLLPSGEK